MTESIPSSRAVAVALNGMTAFPQAIAPLLPFVMSPVAAASSADALAIAALADAFLPRGTAGTPEDRAFQVARLLVAALTPGAIVAEPTPPGDDAAAAAAIQAVWSKVQQANGYYLGVGSGGVKALGCRSPDLISQYRARTGDQTLLIG